MPRAPLPRLPMNFSAPCKHKEARRSCAIRLNITVLKYALAKQMHSDGGVRWTCTTKVNGVASQLHRVYNVRVIAHLRGRLILKHPNQAIVEAGGVGYDVTITVPTFSQLPSTGAEVALHIHTHVREDALALYGFLRADEKQLFEKLVTVSGIGPKLAITILSGMATADMVGAIRSNDHARLTKIPGIGRKIAERMCVELRDKLEAFGVPQPVVTHSAAEEDVISALTNLGYQRSIAEKAVERGVQSAGRDNFDAMFRAALAALSK